MSQLVADYILERLREWDVHRIYGYPGDGINALLGALDRADGDPELIQVRHEEMAAFMACGHAKFTGEVGVCLATSGPGAIHLLNGLYDAKLDHQPVVAIVGQQARAALGGDYQQEVDLVTLFKDVAHEYVQMATHPAQIRHLVDRAVRIALVAAHGHVPDRPERPGGDGGGRAAAARARHDPLERRLLAAADRAAATPSSQRAAEILNEGEKVAMLVGQGALGAGDEVIEVARRLGAGVAKALLGRAVAARRPAVRHRLDRPARHAAELGADAGLRHAADGRLELPVLGVPARGGQGARRADRHRRAHDRHPLPDGRPPRRRRRRDAARAAAAARAEGRPLAGRSRSRRSVAATGGS